MYHSSQYLLAILLAFQVSSASAQQIEIQLRTPTVTCTQNTICIGDIADLSGGNPTIREQVASLDLDRFPTNQTSLQITTEQIRYRALMAGVGASKFQLVCDATTVVQYASPVDTARLVERAIHQRLADSYKIPADLLEVQLLSSVESLISRTGIDVTSLTVEPQIATELPLGQRMLELKLTDGAKRSVIVNASVKITLFRDLVMVKETISRGDLLDREKLERVRRPIDDLQVGFASYEQAIGKTAQNDIQQFSLVKPQFVAETEPIEEKIIVKRNALMTILVRQAGLTVELHNARANDNGRVGDTIGLINPKSKVLVYAKIVNATTAIIE